ncbi:MAG: hypothetical protein IIB61_06015 [Planctomycetes bacterium]|nr:hypothetical protein [Planctomycetota bacterium]
MNMVTLLAKAVSHARGRRISMFLAVSAFLAPSLGCARVLTISQDDIINNASERDGEWLHVDIVCVYPEDLENPQNQALDPDGTPITAKVWAQRRPTGVPGEGRFELPKKQVYYLSHKKDLYGTWRGRGLSGAKLDGTETIRISGIEFDSSKWHKTGSVIYVFPMFAGRDGSVLPTQPVVFNPPGDFHRDLYVKIGTGSGHENQFIKITTKRKLHTGKDAE